MLGALTSPERRARQATSMLCLPLGAIEQHGAHLPLNTDVVIAEECRAGMLSDGASVRSVALPTIAVGLSREHDWAAGTLSLSIQALPAILRDLARTIARSLPARNLVIVNGHGGNRGILEICSTSCAANSASTPCVLHPFDLTGADTAVSMSTAAGARRR